MGANLSPLYWIMATTVGGQGQRTRMLVCLDAQGSPMTMTGPQAMDHFGLDRLLDLAASLPASCPHVSQTTPDGHGAFCRVCGETLG